MGFDFVATGHYARVFRAETGRHYVARSTSRAKDQSYFLSALEPKALARVLFPRAIARRTVRARARRGLRVADKPDSQEVCFIATKTLRGSWTEGRDDAGRRRVARRRRRGSPRGLATTIGQASRPGYRGRASATWCLDAARNTVVLGDDEDLYARELSCDLAWIDAEAARAARPLTAQIRSRHAAEPVASLILDGDCARASFDEPQRAMAPGQTIAFYDGDVVVGSGVIAASGPA
jgi:tRNA-specific 2-thiouridylase